MNILRFPAAIALLALLSAASALHAQSITMSYVTVGNPNNAGDMLNGNLYGSVSYTYDIGEYDVTDSQYCTFLNDVDPTGANTLALYSPGGDAEYGISFNSAAATGSKYSVISGYANMPVVDVDFWDTLRFVNWMNNGEGNASTETGAYTLIGGNTDGYGTPSNAASLLTNRYWVSRIMGIMVLLPISYAVSLWPIWHGGQGRHLLWINNRSVVHHYRS